MTLSKSEKIVLWGASITGKMVFDIIQEWGFDVYCFVDNDLAKQRDVFQSLPVISFETLSSMPRTTQVVICSVKYYGEILKQLRTAGFCNIISHEEIISSVDFDKLDFEKFDSSWNLENYKHIIQANKESIHIAHLNIVVTTACSLRCKACSSLIPYYRKSQFFIPADIIQSVSALLENVDLIYEVEILGGEPLLHDALNEVVAFLSKSRKILHIDIVTNGTIVPSRELLEKIKLPKVAFVVDDYKDKSIHFDEICYILDNAGFPYRINRHWRWADLGDFSDRKYSLDVLNALQNKCFFYGVNEILNGKLFRCPRSSHASALNLVPDYPEDYLNLDSSLTRDDVRKFLFEEKNLNICKHCNGCIQDNLVLPVAEQMR